jgi:hypothetical protein
MNMSKTGVSGTVYEMEDMGATKELTQAMMDTIANDVGESSNARVTSRQLCCRLLSSQTRIHLWQVVVRLFETFAGMFFETH